MKHFMKLKDSPFALICNGKKTVELRLFDEKRQTVKVGDTIEFTCVSNGKTATVTVIALHIFDSFETLYKNINTKKLGYENGEDASPSDMNTYYSVQEQQKYGVVGIEFEPYKLTGDI